MTPRLAANISRCPADVMCVSPPAAGSGGVLERIRETPPGVTWRFAFHSLTHTVHNPSTSRSVNMADINNATLSAHLHPGAEDQLSVTSVFSIRPDPDTITSEFWPAAQCGGRLPSVVHPLTSRARRARACHGHSPSPRRS